MSTKAVTPSPSTVIEDIRENLLAWYRYVRAIVNEFSESISGLERDAHREDKVAAALENLKKLLQPYAEEAAGKLGLLFAKHGTDE